MIGGSNKSVTNRDLTSTIKIKARTPKAMEQMLATAVTALENLSPYMKFKDERKSKKKSRRDEVIVNQPPPPVSSVIPVELYGMTNGQLADPVKGKGITSPEWKYGAMINPTMRTDTPLGGLNDIKKTQESMNKTLEFVKQGHIFDAIA